MVQRGLAEERWNYAMECSCHLRNVNDKVADGKIASENICGVTFNGRLVSVRSPSQLERRGKAAPIW